MTLTAADRIYFTDPVQRPTTKLPDNPRIVVTDCANPYRNTGARGDIVSITGVTMGHSERWWYVGTDGNHYRGVLLNNHLIQRSRFGISFIGDDAVLGYVTSRNWEEQSFNMTDCRWLSQREDHVGINVINTLKVTDLVMAASWGPELWPTAHDSDALVEAKLKHAKELWEKRRKQAGILEEGMYRDWLHRLEENNFYTDHAMPRPTFGALIEATALVPSSTTIEQDALTPEQRTTLGNLGTLRTVGTRPLSTAIHVPVKFVYNPPTGYTAKGDTRNISTAVLTDELQTLTNDYALQIATVNYRYPVLIAAS